MSYDNLALIIAFLSLVTTILSFTNDGRMIRLLRNLFIAIGILYTIYHAGGYLESGLDYLNSTLEDMEDDDWYSYEDDDSENVDELDEETTELYEAWNDGEATEEQLETLTGNLYKYLEIDSGLFILRNTDSFEEEYAYCYTSGMDAEDFGAQLYGDAYSVWSEGEYYCRIELNEDEIDIYYTSVPGADSTSNQADVQEAFAHWVNGKAKKSEMKVLIKGLRKEIEADPYLNLEYDAENDETIDIGTWSMDDYSDDISELYRFYYEVEDALRYEYLYYDIVSYNFTWNKYAFSLNADYD